MRAVKYLSNQEQVNQSASRRNNVTWVPQVNRSRVIPFHKPNKAINLSMVNKSDVILEGKKKEVMNDVILGEKEEVILETINEIFRKGIYTMSETKQKLLVCVPGA